MGGRELVSSSREVVDVDNCTRSELRCRFIKAECIPPVDQPAGSLQQAALIAKQVQHDGTAAARVVYLHVDDLFGRDASLCQLTQELFVVFDNNFLNVGLIEVDDVFEEVDESTPIRPVELVRPPV